MSLVIAKILGYPVSEVGTITLLPLGGVMSQHKKIERKKELDRKRRRREKSLKLRAKEAKGKTR